MSFSEFLRRCVVACGEAGEPLTAADLARAAGVSPTRMSRALAGGRERFKVESVLRLARACDVDPLEALRQAGYDELVALLESAFWVPMVPPGRMRETVRRYVELARDRQRTVERLVDDLANLPRRPDQAAPATPAATSPQTRNGRRPAARRTRRP